MKLQTKIEGIEQILEPLISSLKSLDPEKVTIQDNEAMYSVLRNSKTNIPSLVVVKFLDSHYGVEDAKILLESHIPASYTKISISEASNGIRNINSLIKEKLAVYSLNTYKEITSTLQELYATTYLLTIGGYSVIILITECPNQRL